MPFDYLKGYQTFSTVAEMDAVVATQLERHTLTQSERAVLLRIAQSALRYPGAAHLKASTIASSVDVSTKTVYRAVKRLAALGVLNVIAGTKKNGIRGASIYCVQAEMSQRVPAEKACQDGDAALNVGEETISFNLLKTSTLDEMYNHIHYLNDWQTALYDVMMSLPICDDLKDGLYKAIVATPIHTQREFVVARDTLFAIIRDVQNGRLTIETTLRAIYKGAYNQALMRPKIAQPKRETTRPVAFYDWLAVRESSKG